MKQGFYVYLLGTLEDNGFRTYVGWTNNLDQRLIQHNKGNGARSTKGRMWQILYAEKFKTRKEAMSREWYLKKDRKFRSQFKITMEA